MIRATLTTLAAGPLVAAAITPSPIPAVAADVTLGWAPCAQEDSPGPCVWDARHSGNGVGRSFIVRRGGKVVYVHHARAHRMLHGG